MTLLLRRPGFWLVLGCLGLGLPMLGGFSLIDPWETHYAEVAREMLERHDYISPWWANEGWFRSKPVLLFWLEALSMFLLRVNTGPNGMLEHGAHPEWAVRLPGFVLAVLATYILYYGISRTVSRRAGLLGAMLLWSMPGFSLLTHQAITDTPMIAGVAASLGLLLRALETADTDAPAHVGWLLAVLIGFLIVPQLWILASQHSTFSTGSPHACGLPSQPACEVLRYAHPRWTAAAQLGLFVPLSIALLARIATTRRTSHLFAIGAAACAALATMAKGPIGLVVPAAAVLAVMLARRSWRPLARLDLVTCLLVIGVLVAPWYLAAWARHGKPFWDELVMRNMLGRTLEHLHDTNEGEDTGFVYFVKQLGYATFPWSGLVALTALAAPRGQRTVARPLLLGAAGFAFVLVSLMHTKFHHYGLVAVPPLAMLLGIWLDERMSAAARGELAHLAVVLAVAAGLTALVGQDLAAHPNRLMHLFTYRYARVWPSTSGFGAIFAWIAAAVGLATFALAYERRAVLLALLIGLGFSVFVLDVYLPRAASDGGQRLVLEAYYRERPTGSTVPLVAYQLNWKGENFYTGNDLAIFKTSGPALARWLADRPRPWFFVTEAGRLTTLRSELGPERAVVALTGSKESSEFVLVRAD